MIARYVDEDVKPAVMLASLPFQCHAYIHTERQPEERNKREQEDISLLMGPTLLLTLSTSG